jgi:catechol 2,3-dioxygenase-like lactoylglutathione lyase family enzyme
MLGEKDVAATLAVSDLQRARDFYENTLGLSEVMGQGDFVLYRSGSSMVLVYQSEHAGTNKATAASWAAGSDFDAVVDDLRAKGVSFERYDDLPDTTREGDVHTFGDDLRSIWFKDPDGNILNVANMSAG